MTIRANGKKFLREPAGRLTRDRSPVFASDHLVALSTSTAGYAHPRNSLVTLGITTHVIRGTATAVVIPSLTTTGRPASRGSAAMTIPVINGKIVLQVSSAIL